MEYSLWPRDVEAVDVSLTRAPLEVLEKVLHPGVTAGARYPEKQLAGPGI